MGLLIALLLFNLLCLALCIHLARKRHANHVFWGAMGAIFGPFAVIALLLRPDVRM